MFTIIQPHGLLFRFIILHISNSSVSTLLVEHVLYSVDFMCYKSPRKEIVSCVFKYLIYNLKSYNRIEI